MSTSFKPQPQIRQHGFHLPSPPREDEYSSNDMQDSFRQPPMDFTDELVSLMSSEKQQQGPPPPAQQQQPQSPYDDYRPQTTHNIFDISAPNMGQHHFALNPTNTSHHDSSRLDFPSHFNSTLPALNSSMRYEPHPDPPLSGFRPNSRSRSRSRPPAPNTGVGPVRTRRGNSVSSSVGGAPSPPPGNRPHPHAIVIPGSHPRPGTSNSSWLSNGQDPYSLPTPESLHSPSLLSSHNQYSPFGFSPSNHHHHDHAAYGSLPSHHNLAISPITGGINTLGFATSPVTPTPSSVPSHSAAALPTPSTSSSSATPTTNGTPTAASAQSAAEKLANEKRRRRRESHNAVERRRRDNINERIGELATLIPECMLNDSPSSHVTDEADEGASPPVKERNPNSGMKKGDDGVVKANKGMILRKSVDYIRYLQELVDAQGQRNRQLEQELKAYRSGAPPSSSSPTTTPVMPTLPGSSTSSAPGTNGLVSFGEDEWMDVDPSAQYGILGYPLTNSTKSHSRSTARGSDSGGSPLTQIEEDDSEDEERGRAIRSRRVKKEV